MLQHIKVLTQTLLRTGLTEWQLPVDRPVDSMVLFNVPLGGQTEKMVPLKWIPQCLPLSPNSFKTCGTHFSLSCSPLLTSSHLTLFLRRKQTLNSGSSSNSEPTAPQPSLLSSFFHVCVNSPLIPSFAAFPRLLHFYLVLLLKTLRRGLGGMLLE